LPEVSTFLCVDKFCHFTPKMTELDRRCTVETHTAFHLTRSQSLRSPISSFGVFILNLRRTFLISCLLGFYVFFDIYSAAEWAVHIVSLCRFLDQEVLCPPYLPLSAWSAFLVPGCYFIWRGKVIKKLAICYDVFVRYWATIEEDRHTKHQLERKSSSMFFFCSLTCISKGLSVCCEAWTCFSGSLYIHLQCRRIFFKFIFLYESEMRRLICVWCLYVFSL